MMPYVKSTRTPLGCFTEISDTTGIDGFHLNCKVSRLLPWRTRLVYKKNGEIEINSVMQNGAIYFNGECVARIRFSTSFVLWGRGQMECDFNEHGRVSFCVKNNNIYLKGSHHSAPVNEVYEFSSQLALIDKAKDGFILDIAAIYFYLCTEDYYT